VQFGVYKQLSCRRGRATLCDIESFENDRNYMYTRKNPLRFVDDLQADPDPGKRFDFL